MSDRKHASRQAASPDFTITSEVDAFMPSMICLEARRTGMQMW